MLLFIGISSESPMEMVIQAAEKAAIPYLLLDQRELHGCNLTLGFMRNSFYAILQFRNKEYDMEKFSGVYFRLMDFMSMPHASPHSLQYIGADQVQKSALLQQQLMNWLDMTTIRVLNPPWSMASNMSKPYQSQLIKNAGFLIPPTCITTEVAALQAFKQQYGPVIYKSVSGIRSIVQELGPADNALLAKIRYLPTQFQQKLAGNNIRVHVVGDRLFATLVNSEVTDYRYARRENKTASLSAFTLPQKIARNCFRLSKDLGLPLCGIDLFRNQEDAYYCFEANPSPGFSYFESNTGQDISGSIARWLYYGTAK